MKGNTNAAVFSPDAFIDASYEDDTLKLKAIDDYCKAVEATKTAAGYPANVPAYPETISF